MINNYLGAMIWGKKRKIAGTTFKEINRLINKMNKWIIIFTLKSTFEKNWHSQNFTFVVSYSLIKKFDIINFWVLIGLNLFICYPTWPAQFDFNGKFMHVKGKWKKKVGISNWLIDTLIVIECKKLQLKLQLGFAYFF